MKAKKQKIQLNLTEQRRNQDMYETAILSVQQTSFKQDNGTERVMWRVFCADSTGAVGCIYSSKEHHAGEIVNPSLVVNRDGRFTARIME